MAKLFYGENILTIKYEKMGFGCCFVSECGGGATWPRINQKAESIC